MNNYVEKHKGQVGADPKSVQNAVLELLVDGGHKRIPPFLAAFLAK